VNKIKNAEHLLELRKKIEQENNKAARDFTKNLNLETRDWQAEKANILPILDNADKKTAGIVGAGRVECRPGCSSCCRQMVFASYIEAYVAVKEAIRKNVSINKDRLRAIVRDMSKSPSRQEWASKWEPCIFLDGDGRCSVYDSRPLACRAVVVSSDKAECAKPNGEVVRYDNKEVIHDAYAKIAAEHVNTAITPMVAALPEMVLMVLEGRRPAQEARPGLYNGIDDEMIEDVDRQRDKRS
jgi:Fe-S-cluster containining protein